MLDARIASALNRIIHNTQFTRKVSLEEQKAPKEDRFLSGRQIADLMVTTYSGPVQLRPVLLGPGLSGLFGPGQLRPIQLGPWPCVVCVCLNTQTPKLLNPEP